MYLCHVQVFGLEEGRGAAGGVKVTQGAGQGAKVGVEALAALVSAVAGSPPAKGRTLEVRLGAWEARYVHWSHWQSLCRRAHEAPATVSVPAANPD